MNQPTQINRLTILSILTAAAILTVAALTALPTFATPASLPPALVTEIISLGTFKDLDIMAKTDIDPGPARLFWRAEIDADPASDLYVVRNTFQPGATTGWHTHPGPSMITVTEGAITAYEGKDPTCTGHVYPAGSTFVDHGGGQHVHLLRNESNAQAVTVAVQLIPAGAIRRIDAPVAPPQCPPF